jgi:hypothetical protein
MSQKFTVKVRRGLDTILELAEEYIRETASNQRTADERRDVDAALQWMKENGEASKSS